MKYILLLFIGAHCLVSQLRAQTPVTITVATKDHALVLQTDKDKRLGTVYFGNSLSDNNEYALVTKQRIFIIIR